MVAKACDAGELYEGVLLLQAVRPAPGLEEHVSLGVQAPLSGPQLLDEPVYHGRDLLLDRGHVLHDKALLLLAVAFNSDRFIQHTQL